MEKISFRDWLKRNPEEAERIKDLWVKTIDEGGKWWAISEGFDKSGTINYVRFILLDKDEKVKWLSPIFYCGGVVGGNRIFEQLYQAFIELYGTGYENYSKYVDYTWI